MRKQSAFTLVEALVVFAIIGIMVTVAMPAFSRFYQMYKFRTAMNQLVTDIRSARQAAITNGRPVKFTLIDVSLYPEVRGVSGGYAFYMLNSTAEADMDSLANWLEIAPLQNPCGGRAEKPRFLPTPIEIDPATAHLENVESDDIDEVFDLVFLPNGSLYEGPYPQGDNAGARLAFSDDVTKPADLSPAFTMKTVSKTAFDRYVIYFSLFGKVSVHPYHS